MALWHGFALITSSAPKSRLTDSIPRLLRTLLLCLTVSVHNEPSPHHAESSMEIIETKTSRQTQFLSLVRKQHSNAEIVHYGDPLTFRSKRTFFNDS
jgi:hypothetical protein